MPFPWKKTRATRISQIVADLQSPKRGGSLVVETGFPTSLVDLFVKHSDRLKKPSTRKKSRKKRSKNEIYDGITQQSSPPSPHPLMNPSGCAGNCTESASLEMKISKIFEEAEVVGDHGCDLVGSRTETRVVGGGAAGGNVVCMVAFKMFVVAVLALSTKKLVVGITLSASLLLLLEFVGERAGAVRFLKPCLNGKAVLKSMVVKGSRHFWIRKNDTVAQNLGNCEQEAVPVPAASISREDASTGSPELRSSIEEIQLVEPIVDTGERPKVMEEETHQLDCFRDKKRWDCLDGEKNVTELQVCENQRGTQRKLNGRIFKKLVPKKYGNSVIEKNNKGKELELRSERFNHLGVDRMLVEEQSDQEEEEDEFQEQEQARETRNILCEEGEEEEKRKPPGFGFAEHWPASVVKVAETCEIHGNEREESLSYLILVLIVLAGLFGGRILAVILTIAGCFVFKVIEIPRRRSPNLPLTE